MEGDTPGHLHWLLQEVEAEKDETRVDTKLLSICDSLNF